MGLLGRELAKLLKANAIDPGITSCTLSVDATEAIIDETAEGARLGVATCRKQRLTSSELVQLEIK